MIVLASASPRRRELLASLGLAFQIDPARGPEAAPIPGDPAGTVLSLSAAKAREVAARHPEALVIGADTVVEKDGVILGKPADGAEAVAMLRRLSGGEHRVFTGLAVVKDGTLWNEAEETFVRFRALSEREMAAYAATGEPLDKAGAYAVQGLAALFVEGIRGDYFNVVGLPLCRLGRMLARLGVTIL